MEDTLRLNNNNAIKFSANPDGTVNMTRWDLSINTYVSTFLNGHDVYACSNVLWVDGELYTGPDYSNIITGIRHAVLPPGGGPATWVDLVTDTGITSWSMAGGRIFYTNASATYTLDAAGGTPSLYSTVPVVVQGL